MRVRTWEQHLKYFGTQLVLHFNSGTQLSRYAVDIAYRILSIIIFRVYCFIQNLIPDVLNVIILKFKAGNTVIIEIWRRIIYHYLHDTETLSEASRRVKTTYSMCIMRNLNHAHYLKLFVEPLYFCWIANYINANNKKGSAIVNNYCVGYTGALITGQRFVFTGSCLIARQLSIDGFQMPLLIYFHRYFPHSNFEKLYL